MVSTNQTSNLIDNCKGQRAEEGAIGDNLRRESHRSMEDGGSDEAFDLFAVDSDGNLSSSIPKLSAKFQPKRKGFLPQSALSPPSCHATKQEVLAETKPVGSGSDMMVVDGVVAENSIVKVVDSGSVVMDVDEVVDAEEDFVVREIDVFLKPSPLDDSKLCLVQYPLRPYWRPYDLDDRCQSVRVDKDMKMELDLTLDVDGENYSDEVDEHMISKVQTLSSVKVPFVTNYAIGMLQQNQLYLNPVRAAIQLRPLMDGSSSTTLQKRKNADQIEGNADEESTSKASTSGTWVHLDYHSTKSPVSSGYHQRMVAYEKSEIHFQMNMHDYLKNLCPMTSDNSNRTKGPSKGMLLSIPLEDRLEVLFKEGPQVQHFDALMHFASSYSDDDVLKLLPQFATLVQGLWVSKSSLLFEGRDVLFRDFVLLLFSKSSLIPFEKLKPIKMDVAIGTNEILSPLARQRPSLKDWKFREPTDFSFIKRYPHIVKHQESVWADREKVIMDALRGFSKSKIRKEAPNPSSVNPISSTTNPNHGKSAVKSMNERSVSSTTGTMTNGAQEIISKSIVMVLQKHKVCSLPTIRQRLQEMALQTQARLSKVDTRSSICAAVGFFSSPNWKNDVKDAIDQVAVRIHDVYVLKSLGQQELDPFRNIVIDLYRGKEPKAKLKKAEILAAAKIRLKRDVSNSDYSQVVNELCISHRGGGWALKSGDGEPD